MKRLLSLVGVLLLGFVIGWYVDHRQTSTRNRTDLKVPTDETVDHGDSLPEFMVAIRQDDQLAAAVGLRAVYLLERGDAEGAKKFLAQQVGSYYRLYHDKRADTNLIRRIETAAQKYPIIAAELAKKTQ